MLEDKDKEISQKVDLRDDIEMENKRESNRVSPGSSIFLGKWRDRDTEKENRLYQSPYNKPISPHMVQIKRFLPSDYLNKGKQEGLGNRQGWESVQRLDSVRNFESQGRRGWVRAGSINGAQ